LVEVGDLVRLGVLWRSLMRVNFRREFAALFLVAAAAHAQGTRATLVGRVTDESGSVVPKTKITVVNLATNEARVLEAGDSGEFVVAQLQPGEYTLTAEQRGFNKEIRTGIVLETGLEARLDVILKVGSVTEEVS